MSEPWQDTSRSSRRSAAQPASAARDTADTWSRDPGTGDGWSRDAGADAKPAAPLSRDARAQERGHLAGRRPPERRPAPPSPGGTSQLTGRGAIAGMLVLFFFGLLVSTWLHWGPLAGGTFVLGSVGAAWYTKQRDLLTVAVSPPLLFFCALIVVKALTASGSAVISTAEGTMLTLANVAPWLFAGVVLSLVVACFRGLPRCISDLRRELRPDLIRPRPGPRVPPGRS